MSGSQAQATMTWPEHSVSIAPGPLAVPALVVNLRTFTPPADLLKPLTELSDWCIRSLAALQPVPTSLAVVVRHLPAPSGRVSGSLFGEAALCGLRGLARQLRYDRSWTRTALTFVDAGDVSDEEITSLVGALAGGQGRVEVERSSGVTVAASWKGGQSL